MNKNQISITNAAQMLPVFETINFFLQIIKKVFKKYKYINYTVNQIKVLKKLDKIRKYKIYFLIKIYIK